MLWAEQGRDGAGEEARVGDRDEGRTRRRGTRVQVAKKILCENQTGRDQANVAAGRCEYKVWVTAEAPRLFSVEAPGLPSVEASGLLSVQAPGLPSVEASGLPNAAWRPSSAGFCPHLRAHGHVCAKFIDVFWIYFSVATSKFNIIPLSRGLLTA
eukprot:363950-Chlamydomonas_euryale.AAC.2